jgi:hypothetical protein
LINPTITSPPLSQSVVRSGSVTFSAGFSGNPLPFGVQWRQGAVTLVSNSVSGFQDFFTLTNAQPANAGTWRVVVNNLASASGNYRTFTLTVLADSDGDGLPDAWELAYGLRTNNAFDATQDLDGDGLSNRDEYSIGTNPTNAQSCLRIQTIARSNTAEGTTLTFLAVSNKTYTVEALANAGDGSWFRVADVVAAGTNRMIQVIEPPDLTAPVHRYYRLVSPRTP